MLIAALAHQRYCRNVTVTKSYNPPLSKQDWHLRSTLLESVAQPSPGRAPKLATGAFIRRQIRDIEFGIHQQAEVAPVADE